MRMSNSAAPLTLVALLLAIAPPRPAHAAPLGSVDIGQSNGKVTDTPVLAAVTTSAPCPLGYGANALLRVGPPNGPFTNIARPLTDGGYDRGPVKFQPNRSFATALGGTPGDGVWWVVVECFSAENGRHQDRFVTPITVAGATWRLGGAGDGTGPTPTVHGPADSVSAGAGPAPAGDNTAAPGAAGETDRGRSLTGGQRRGRETPVEILIAIGLLLIAGAVSTALAVRHRAARRPATPGKGR